MRRASHALGFFLGWAAFVVYGSLVPLEYKALPLDEAWARFQQTPFLHLGLESRADWVANGVLYAPLGFFATRAGIAARLPALLAAALAMLLGCAMAVGVEFTQLYFPARTVSLNDIYAECIGSVVGAAVAPFMGGWLARMAQAWRAGGAHLGPRLLELYTAAYVLLCFFPYDLLLSAAELQGKWLSTSWGWLLAPQDRGVFLVVVQLLVEVAMAMPIGVLLVRLDPRGRQRLLLAAVTGTLLGLTIEVGQFFVESGVSQGASVASRAVGTVLGAALAPWLRSAGLAGVRLTLRPLALAAWLAYLPLLAGVNGAFKHPWHGADGAAASWQTTHLLPFYYHYYTTEALAVFSLGSVGLMYLPVAVLGWARGWRDGATLLAAAGLATAVEIGKLFVDTLHADPTNVLIAVAVNALALRLLSLAMAVAPTTMAALAPCAAAKPAAAAVHRRSAAAAGAAVASGPRLALAGLVLLGVAATLLGFPLGRLALAVVFAVAGIAVWRRPLLALGLLPAALPVLDLAPWSGRFYWDEFDMLSAACLALAWARSPPPAARPPLRPSTLAFALLAASLAASTLVALSSAGWPDTNSFSHYYSPYNALRIVKGAVWAWLFVRLWQRLAPQGVARARVFGAGMMAGLALTVAWVVWERLIFTGLFDFGADYRVTGPFSAMHKGGAYIECWLAVASAFTMAAALRARSVWTRAGACALLAAACYAMMVTYSRNGWAALAVALLLSLAVALASGWRRRSGLPRQLAFGTLLVALVLGIALPIAGGSYARQRLAQSGQDLGVRQAHWADGLALRDDSLLTALLGMGLGRYPESHYWRSQEPVHAASYRVGSEGGARHLRLAQGATLYIEQIVPRPDVAVLHLAMDIRPSQPQAGVVAMLCEKWTLTSLQCATATADATPAPTAAPATALPPAPGSWRHVDLMIDASRLLARGGVLHAPLKLSLLTPNVGSVDITHLRLRTALGDELLVNGDFADGMDHWFFATDVDPPWHLHSLPLAVLFDQGWLGVLAWAAVVATALVSGAALVARGQAQAPAALAALGAYLVCGSLNTLIDAPRFLGLLLVLLWLAGASAGVAAAAATPTATAGARRRTGSGAATRAP